MPGTVRLGGWPETGLWSRWTTEHQLGYLEDKIDRAWENIPEGKICLLVCIWAGVLGLYLHSDTPVRQQSWWTPPGLIDLCSVSLSFSSFRPWNDGNKTAEKRRDDRVNIYKIIERGMSYVLQCKTRTHRFVWGPELMLGLSVLG